jgi:hypothetical protein
MPGGTVQAVQHPHQGSAFLVGSSTTTTAASISTTTPQRTTCGQAHTTAASTPVPLLPSAQRSAHPIRSAACIVCTQPQALHAGPGCDARTQCKNSQAWAQGAMQSHKTTGCNGRCSSRTCTQRCTATHLQAKPAAAAAAAAAVTAHGQCCSNLPASGPAAQAGPLKQQLHTYNICLLEQRKLWFTQLPG